MVLSGEATAVSKDHSGIVEAIRVLRVARAGAVKSRTACTASKCRRASDLGVGATTGSGMIIARVSEAAVSDRGSTV
jgi:hypothetical protein